MTRGVEGTGTPTGWVYVDTGEDFTAARQGIRVVSLDRGYRHDVAETSPWLLQGAKTLSYATNRAALREAARRGADDVIFVSSDGYALEGPTSNVIVRNGDRVRTPQTDQGILAGTTQASVFEFFEARGIRDLVRAHPGRRARRRRRALARVERAAGRLRSRTSTARTSTWTRPSPPSSTPTSSRARTDRPHACTAIAGRGVAVSAHPRRLDGLTNVRSRTRRTTVSEHVPTSLEVLRQQARDELSAVIEYRCRQGDDPWEFIPDLPSVDEQVVHTLREDAVEAYGLGEERARAHHPTASRTTLVRFEYQLLRQIALDHPDLSTAVWGMLDRLDPSERRADADVRPAARTQPSAAGSCTGIRQTKSRHAYAVGCASTATLPSNSSKPFGSERPRPARR